jgi:hypothetical protein
MFLLPLEGVEAMSGFWDAVGEFTKGFLEGASEIALAKVFERAGNERGRIERLCHQLGWGVDERMDDTIILHFDHPTGERRQVFIDNGDDELVSFVGYSEASMPADNVPTEVTGYMVRQNASMAIGAWQVFVKKDGHAIFYVGYQALGAGLTAEALKYICESLVGETAVFDARMQEAGLLEAG